VIFFRPIVLSRPEKLVYSGHIYPFSSSIADQSYPNFKETMINMQAGTQNCYKTSSILELHSYFYLILILDHLENLTFFSTG
jgi:hypothetical protein